MNSSLRMLAGRYAAAYDQLSHTAEEAARRAEELSLAARALEPVRELLMAPDISPEQKQQAIRSALQQLPHTADFLEVLLAAKRYDLLPDITLRVQALADKRQGIIRARVVSAQPLSSAEKKKIQNTLSVRYGGKVEASFQIDKTILGGLKIWCNGELIDGSWQAQFDRLQDQLLV